MPPAGDTPERPAPDARRPGPGPVSRVLRGVGARVRGTLSSWRHTAAWLWKHRPPRRRAIAIILVAALALAGAAGTLFQAGLASRLPGALDWAAARALVERDARPGDAVVLSPAWLERARAVLPADVPVLTASRYAGEDLVGVRRAWLLSVPDAPGFSWDVELDLLERALRSDPVQRVGAFEVSRHDVALPALPLAFLPDRLGAARVTAGDVACLPGPDGVVRCPAPHAVRVERTVRDAGGAPRPCLALHLDEAAGVPVRLAFGPVPVGRTVRGHVGGAAGATVRVSLQLDGEEAGAAEVAGGGWTAFQLDTTRFAGRSRDLMLVVGATGAPASIALDAVVLP